MQTPRNDKIPTTLNSYPYHYLGLTDYVELEKEARRMRALVLAGMLGRGLRAVADRLTGAAQALATPQPKTTADFDAEVLRSLGLDDRHIPTALAGQRIGNFIGEAWQRIVAAMQRATAEAELQSLDDRTLHDMGLSRSSIPAAVAGEIYRPTKPSNENAGEAKIQTLKARAEAAA